MLLLGGGLWNLKLRDLDPPVEFMEKGGMTYMVTPSGEMFGITMVTSSGGRNEMLMVDSRGNLYLDPSDRSQGIYIVDNEANVLNLSVSTSESMGVRIKRLGNLKDVKQLTVSNIGDVRFREGKVIWAFTDAADTPIEIDPYALVQRDDKGKPVGVGLPSSIDEGVIKVVKEKRSLFNLFGPKKDYGGPLERSLD